MNSDPFGCHGWAQAPRDGRRWFVARAWRRVLGHLPLLALCVLTSTSSAQVAKGPPRIRNLYIPADQVQVLFDDGAKGVLMPREKILSLWKKAQRQGKPEESAPADTVLAQATYEARLDEHALRIAGRIEIAKLRDGWQAVEMPFGGLAIESAQVEGRPARFGRKDDGTLFLVLREQGRVELHLEMSVPLASKDGDLAATLKLPPVPASEVLLRLHEGKRVHLGATALQADPAEDGRQLFRIAVDHSGLVPLVISDRFAGGKRTPLVFADSRLIGRIEPAGLRLDFALDLDVYARAQETFQLRLPDTVNVAEIEAPQLGAWTIQKQDDGTATVHLAFRKPVLGRRSVRLLALAPFPSDTQWNLPNIEVLPCASHVGQVFLYSAPSLRVEVGDLAGIRSEPLAPNSTGSADATDTPLTFAFWDKRFQLPLQVIPRRRRLQASVATLVEIDRAGASLRSSVTIEPRHAPVFGLEMQLPSDWEITSVLAAQQPVEWESAAPGVTAADANARGQRVRFDLAKPIAPGESLELALTAQRHPEQWLKLDETFSELPLPEVRLVDADEVEGTLLVQSPADIELQVADPSNGLQPVAADRSGTEPDGTALQYSYQDNARISGRLQVRPKRPKVSAETLSFVRLERGKLDMHYQLDLHIRQGRLRRIGFTLPSSVGEKIRVVPSGSPARVIEQRHTPFVDSAAADADLTLWQIVLDRPVTGDLTLALDFEQILSRQTGGGEADSSGGETASAKPGGPVEVPVLVVRDVSRQSGMVALEAAGDQQIDYESENLRGLDPADVSQPKAYVPSQRIVAAYQYPRLPYRLTISAIRHESEPVLSAICTSAAINSIAKRDGRMRHQARFWLRTANVQQVPVTLPEKTDLWTVMLDGEPIEVRRSRGTCIVPLPAGPAGSAVEDHELTLLYETNTPLPAGDGLQGRFWPRTIRQRAPQVGMATLETAWQVHPPEGTEVVATDGDFEPEAGLPRSGLVNRLADTIAHHSTRATGWKLVGVVVALVFAGLFVLVKSAKNGRIRLLEVLAVVGVIVVLIALLLPATQSARCASRSAQCQNYLRQIGISLLVYADHHGHFPPAAFGPSDVPPHRQFSWIVALLPYLEGNKRYDKLRFDLPCDHPHNAALLQEPPHVVMCPSDPTSTTVDSGAPKTSYVAITGADWTMGSGGTRGVIGFDRGLKLDEIVDGTSNTLLVAEVTDGGPWYAGGAGTARRIDDWIRKDTWSHHESGANFLFADGSVQHLEADTDPQKLRGLATAQGMERLYEDGALAGEEAAEDADREVPASEHAAMEEEAEPQAAESGRSQQEQLSKGPPRRHPQRGERARLSLRIALDVPEGKPISFHRDGGPGELVLRLRDRNQALTLQWLIVAALLLAAWLWRHAPRNRRAIAFVLGIAVPMALSGLSPPVLVPVLDGLLLGTLAAGGLWMLVWGRAIVAASLPTSSAAALLIAAGLAMAARTTMAEQTPAQNASASPPAESREPNLTLFIPYDPEDKKPLESMQVYLPHDEFLRLWKMAHPEQPDASPPDAGPVVSHAEYAGRVDGDVARFDGRLLIHHFDDRWARAVLPLGEVAFEKIEVDGQPANLANDGPAAIYLRKPGACVVDVRFAVPVSRLGVTGQMIVPLRAVPSGCLRLTLPTRDLDVQVTGGPGGWRHDRRAANPEPSAENGGESISIPLGTAGELSIRWQPRRLDAREGRSLSVDQSTLVKVVDSGVHLHGKLHYRVEQGAVSKLQLRIPTELAVRRVHGPEVASWSIETDASADDAHPKERLVVLLKADCTTSTEVEVETFRRGRLPAATIEVDAPEPLGVARETGRVAVACANPFRLRAGQTRGLDQIDWTGLELSESVGNSLSIVSAYRYTARPWRLPLHVERKRPHVAVTEYAAVAVTARQVNLRSLLTVDVTGAPVPSLSFRLPASLRVAQVRVPSGAEWFVDGNDADRRLKVELDKPAAGTMSLAISGTLVRESSVADLAVPCITLADAEAHRGELAIHLDDDLEAVLADDGGARSINPDALDSSLRVDGGPRMHYAFAFDSPPEGLRLRLSAAPSRASADVTTVVSVRDGSVAYISQVDFEIRQAGRSRFRVMAPTWLGDDVRLQGDHIRLVRSRTDDRGRIWEIELQQPVRGAYRLHLIQTLPLADDDTVPAALIRPLDVERSRNHVVLENLTSDEIAPTSTNGAVPVAIDAVPEGLADDTRRQAVAAYRVAPQNAELVWQRRVRQRESGLAATIVLADLTTVMFADGRYRGRAIYNIRNMTLQFLEVEMPPESRVWSVHVSGQPVRPAKIPRNGRPAALLPLQKTSAGDFSSKVVLVFSGRLENPLGQWSQVQPPAPRILSDVPVSRTLWTVLLPSEYKANLVEGRSNLEQVVAAYQQEERKLSFLDEMRQVLQVASQRGKSAAREKARYNIKGMGSELQHYARQPVRTEAENAADVQQQAQQLEAEVKRLEEWKPDMKRADDDAGSYFRQPQPKAAQTGVDLDLSGPAMPGGHRTATDGAGKKPHDAAENRPEQRRGDLRRQADKQLDKLQAMAQEGRGGGQAKAAQKSTLSSETEQQPATSAMPLAPDQPAERAPLGGQAAPAVPLDAGRQGRLSLDFELPLAGRAYHFRKLHGEPRLVLRATHEDIGRWLAAGVWAGLCLMLAVAAIYVVRRPNASALAQRYWPWLAAVAGAIWLFLLPAGFLGVILLATALCTLGSRA